MSMWATLNKLLPKSRVRSVCMGGGDFTVGKPTSAI